MTSDNTLENLGWSDFFQTQITPEDAEQAPMRVSEVHRDKIRALSPAGTHLVVFPSHINSGDVAVGDWVLVDEDLLRVTRVLERRSSLSRRAAGPELRKQLVASNVDTLFIVTSCNADFNEARIERFISMAYEAGTTPIVVATKADSSDDPSEYVRRAEALSFGQIAFAINAHDPEDLAKLAPWCGPRQTIALLGSSGVGKTTITNGIAGTNEATASIREDDARGRHTTTSRALHRIKDGGWLVDTPGMREFGLFDASEGINTVFQDVIQYADQCKFRDCAHEGEPGCAVQKAIKSGDLDPDRLTRWQKLQREDSYQAETVAQTRKRSRATVKMHKTAKQLRNRKIDGA